MNPLPAPRALDQYFLEARSKLLDLAAILDRIGRGENADTATTDARVARIDKALEVLAKTFGALPKRADKKPGYTEARKVAFPSEPRDKDFSFTTDIARSYALAYWPTADMLDIKRTRRLILLGQILDLLNLGI